MEGISIIIPVYNKLEITLRCIEHIRKMNRKGVAEIIIVDNGSTDATPVMLSKQSDIAYIRSLENLGIAKAFNCAAENAKGDIFCFMHNDVFVHEQEWAARLAAFIRTTTDAGVVGLYGAKMLRKSFSATRIRRQRTTSRTRRLGPMNSCASTRSHAWFSREVMATSLCSGMLPRARCRTRSWARSTWT